MQIVYDIETFPRVFTLSACEHGKPETMFTWEISYRRDDREQLMMWFQFLADERIEMIGFNNLAFDYVVIDFLFHNPFATAEQLYAVAMQIINTQDRFGQSVPEWKRFAPQIDLFKIHHFDNVAKSTSLKALQFAMRSPSVEDMPVENGADLTPEQIDKLLIPYNRHDVLETDRFAGISTPNIEFRRELKAIVKGDVLNFNDTKIGKQLIEQRLGEELCFERDQFGKKKPRQTHRDFIALGPILFPYISFHHEEFRRVHNWLKEQVIHHTKGVFTDVEATINGFTFAFGTGGIHGSVSARRVSSDADYAIEDIDVAALYPSIAIENGLYPQHLGKSFVAVYAGVRDERKKHAKGTVMNGALKLSANGAYGDSNNQYSPLYDPQFTMAITVNGQLLLCMLADRLLFVPTLEIIQINTDGITYRIARSMQNMARAICQQWERETRLVLEYANYDRMFIRDVNNYLAIDTKGKAKRKGAYWYPEKFPDDISNASPSAWYKDLGAQVVPRAADAAMRLGIDPRIYIYSRTDPFDFMLRAKATRGSQLYIGDKPTQRITRYYMAKNGAQLRKVSPPVAGAVPGGWKRKNGISDGEYYAILREIEPGAWDARIHTGNKSKYEDRETSLQSGWLVADCNRADQFDWKNLNYDWYIEEARKLIIK